MILCIFFDVFKVYLEWVTLIQKQQKYLKKKKKKEEEEDFEFWAWASALYYDLKYNR